MTPTHCPTRGAGNRHLRTEVVVLRLGGPHIPHRDGFVGAARQQVRIMPTGVVTVPRQPERLRHDPPCLCCGPHGATGRARAPTPARRSHRWSSNTPIRGCGVGVARMSAGAPTSAGRSAGGRRTSSPTPCRFRGSGTPTSHPGRAAEPRRSRQQCLESSRRACFHLFRTNICDLHHTSSPALSPPIRVRRRGSSSRRHCPCVSDRHGPGKPRSAAKSSGACHVAGSSMSSLGQEVLRVLVEQGHAVVGHLPSKFADGPAQSASIGLCEHWC